MVDGDVEDVREEDAGDDLDLGKARGLVSAQRTRKKKESQTNLVHDEEEAAQRFGSGLAVVKRDDGRHGTDAETGDEATDGDLSEATDGAGLDRDADGEDGRPEKDRALAAKAVRG